MRAKILLWMILVLVMAVFVDAQSGIETPMVVYQGSVIYVNLIDISSHYDADINVTYPNGSDKIFIAKASVIGQRIYTFSSTSQIGSYRFHSYDTSLGQWSSSTLVEVVSDSILKSNINFVPAGMSFAVINKTFRHDWIVSTPFLNVTLSSAVCKIYSANNEQFVKNADVVDIYGSKRISAETNFSSAYFIVGRSYLTNCSVSVVYGSTSSVISQMTQYVYATKESQIKDELDSMYLIQRQQYNRTTLMFSNVNSTYLNTRTLLNRTTRLNTTLNQINVSVTTLKNVTLTNQGLIQTIKTTVINIWNSIFKINQTINKVNSTLNAVNKTIVTNNTFIINQLKQDTVSAIS
jgi:hypothetical protein